MQRKIYRQHQLPCFLFTLPFLPAIFNQNQRILFPLSGNITILGEDAKCVPWHQKCIFIYYKLYYLRFLLWVIYEDHALPNVE